MITEIVTDGISIKNLKNVNIIYGRNNSGKTKIYNRISTLLNYVKNSVKFERNTLNDICISNAQFQFDLNGKPYTYKFKINTDEQKDRYVEYETLQYIDDNNKTVVIFNRNNKKVSSKVIDIKNIKIALEKYTLVLSLGAFLKINELKQVYWYLVNCKTMDLSPLDVDISTYSSTYPFVANKFVAMDIENQQNINDLVNFLNIIDDSIENITYVKYNDNQYYINTIRNGNSMNIMLENSGIRALFRLYPNIKNAIDTGGLIYIDNINSHLDDETIAKIIEYFNSKNTKNAQFIINTRVKIKDYDCLMNL